MPNLGERILAVKMPSGRLVSMRNQVCLCTGPRTGVAQMVDEDQFIGFSKAGSFILDLKTGGVDLLERVDDTFELELEVIPYEEAKPLLAAAGFPGQP